MSIPGDLWRILNTLYLRRKCPVFAFYGLRYIVYYPGTKAPYTRENGAILRGAEMPGKLLRAERRKSPPGRIYPPRGAAPERSGNKETPERVRGWVYLLLLAAPISISSGINRIYKRVMRSPPRRSPWRSPRAPSPPGLSAVPVGFFVVECIITPFYVFGNTFLRFSNAFLRFC